MKNTLIQIYHPAIIHNKNSTFGKIVKAKYDFFFFKTVIIELNYINKSKQIQLYTKRDNLIKIYSKRLNILQNTKNKNNLVAAKRK